MSYSECMTSIACPCDWTCGCACSVHIQPWSEVTHLVTKGSISHRHKQSHKLQSHGNHQGGGAVERQNFAINKYMVTCAEHCILTLTNCIHGYWSSQDRCYSNIWFGGTAYNGHLWAEIFGYRANREVTALKWCVMHACMEHDDAYYICMAARRCAALHR